jgi:uncharacterized protein YjbI with pentapeptide repeats
MGEQGVKLGVPAVQVNSPFREPGFRPQTQVRTGDHWNSVLNLSNLLITGVKLSFEDPCSLCYRARNKVSPMQSAPASSPADGASEVPRAKLSQQELSAGATRHQAFLNRQSGGMRANFKMRDLSHLDLSGLDLSDADFSGAKLFSARLNGTNLTNANLYGADLRLANLTGATLNRADLRGACLRGAILSEAFLVEADLRDGTLMHMKRSGEMTSVNYESTKIMTELTCATVRKADLTRARVSNAFVMQTDMTDSVMRGTKFVRANLTNSDLTGADLQGADLSDANLTGAKLTGARLTGAQITRSRMTNAVLIGAILDEFQSSLPELADAVRPRKFEDYGNTIGEILAQHMMWMNSGGKGGRRADLLGYDLSGQMLAGANLSAAVLQSATLSKADLSEAGLAMADMSLADLRRAKLIGTDLRGVNMERSTLSGADLSDAKFNPVHIQSGTGHVWRANLRRARLDGANLRNADLRRVNFNEAVLTDADLRGAKLNEADFTGADLRGARLDGADKTGAIGLK